MVMNQIHNWFNAEVKLEPIKIEDQESTKVTSTGIAGGGSA